MAYDEYLADRIRNQFRDLKHHFEEKKMMGGLCFMVDDKMCCGILIDKNTNDSLLMARVGLYFYEEALSKKGALTMDFTGRPMKGYVFVGSEGIDSEPELQFWIQKCLDFNPLVKTSIRKKK
ncbi:TfoX/Sxy family protein [Croceivirga thetidis]|uniref:TfoX/Sxy family protein n=1 Tax=Croceivirga thetidis TaxID=2721623 RepID=A0ABX1GRT2_9FLAO|nr:TfoX/Sxy family protein [Croceivirga thetidis]NKI32641.1 TfoX/Sxy family protein [Croceivirga thetidis]